MPSPRHHSQLLRPARSSAAALAVLALVVLAGVAVYGVVTVARSTPAPAQGKTGTPGGVTGPTASEALQRANPLLTDGKYAEVIAVVQPAIEAYPEEQDLRLMLARAYSGQKDWAKSSAAYEAALVLGSETSALHAEAGTVANAAGFLDLAIERYSRAQTLDPKNPVHPLYLAMVQIKAGKEREAMTNLYMATVLNPELSQAWGSMGELELRANHLDLALQHLEKARKLDPNSLKWRLAEAKVHKRQNEPAKALDLLANLPEKERFSADTIPVVMESLAMLKQKDRRAEYLKAAQGYAKASHDDRAIAEVAKYTDPQP